MRVAAGRRGVEVGRAPDAAVDVLAAPIATGANSHGTVHEASTASADGGIRCARAAEHDPATATRDRPPDPQAVRRSGPELSARCTRAGRRACRSAGACLRKQRRAQQRPAGRRDPERQRRERRRTPPASTPRRGGRHRQRAGREARRAAGGLGRARCRCSSGRRPARRAARDRCAATIEPAEVPTKYSQPRRSNPVASSIPPSTPIIHASPSTPPPPRTSTSGSGDHRVEASEAIGAYDRDCGPRWRT